MAMECARVGWRDQTTPVSEQFDDVYFSTDSGLAEARYVFLEQNDLPQRLRKLAGHEDARLVLGETGFGTGLNLLAAWQLRDQLAPDCLLHFISVEKYPLAAADLARALGQWQQLAGYTEQLIRAYPVLTPGWHRISLFAARVEISLYLGAACDALDTTSATIDAWFLDGFAPAKNPDMWSQAIADRIARLSHPGTTLSTFSAASRVREHFSRAGFEITRVPGFGRKRHMLKGFFSGRSTQEERRQAADAHPPGANPGATPAHATTPWFSHRPQPHETKHAVIIGAGLAGAAAAHSLVRRGWQVTVVDRNQQPAGGASGNSLGILYAKLSAEPSLRSDFYVAGYLYSLQVLRQLCSEGPAADWHASGVLQLACDEAEQRRQRRFMQCNPQPADLVHALDAAAASEVAGLALTSGGLFFPRAGWVRPQSLCRRQLNHPNIRFMPGQHVVSLRREKGRWQLLNAAGAGIASAPVVIFANARDAREIDFCAELPLKSIRGQLTSIPAADNPLPRTVLCGDAYIAPPLGGRIHMGATFNLNQDTPECRAEDHRENLRQIASLAPALGDTLGFAQLNASALQGQVGFRCSSPDYLPLVGPLPNHATFIHQYAGLRKDARARFECPGEFHPGLYVSLGHGAKGLTSCPLAGELLAAYICAEPLPIGKPLTDAVHPARFVIRDLIRNRI